VVRDFFLGTNISGKHNFSLWLNTSEWKQDSLGCLASDVMSQWADVWTLCFLFSPLMRCSFTCRNSISKGRCSTLWNWYVTLCHLCSDVDHNVTHVMSPTVMSVPWCECYLEYLMFNVCVWNFRCLNLIALSPKVDLRCRPDYSWKHCYSSYFKFSQWWRFEDVDLLVCNTAWICM
jgi:hypothetical protein